LGGEGGGVGREHRGDGGQSKAVNVPFVMDSPRKKWKLVLEEIKEIRAVKVGESELEKGGGKGRQLEEDPYCVSI